MPILIRHEIVAPYAQAASNAGQFDANKIVADQQFRQQQAAQDEADRQQAQQIQQQQFQQHLASQAANEEANRTLQESLGTQRIDQQGNIAQQVDQRMRDLQQKNIDSKSTQTTIQNDFRAGENDKNRASTAEGKKQDAASKDADRASREAQADLNRQAADQRNQARISAANDRAMLTAKLRAGKAGEAELTRSMHNHQSLLGAQEGAIDAQIASLADQVQHSENYPGVNLNDTVAQLKPLREEKVQIAKDRAKLWDAWINRDFAPKPTTQQAAPPAQDDGGDAADYQPAPATQPAAAQPTSPSSVPAVPLSAATPTAAPTQLPPEQQLSQAKQLAVDVLKTLPPSLTAAQRKQYVQKALQAKGFDLKAIGAI